MANDAKLGFLVGVAGVVISAVLFFQNQQPGAPKPETSPVMASTSLPAPGPAKPVLASQAAVPNRVVTAGKRKEVEAQPVSRVPDTDE